MRIWLTSLLSHIIMEIREEEETRYPAVEEDNTLIKIRLQGQVLWVEDQMTPPSNICT